MSARFQDNFSLYESPAALKLGGAIGEGDVERRCHRRQSHQSQHVQSARIRQVLELMPGRRYMSSELRVRPFERFLGALVSEALLPFRVLLQPPELLCLPILAMVRGTM